MKKDKVLQKLLADKKQITQKYSDLQPEYKLLTKEVYDLIKKKIQKAGLDPISIEKRTKTKKSFWEKVIHKKYQNPFEDMKDISAIRIICLIPKELKNVERLIRQEFNVQESKNKKEEMTPYKFWYRSHHFKITLENDQINKGKYKLLKNFEAEIQIRSVLMHAWAEMEHKINYKNKFKLAEKKKRRIARLSALLELADALLDEI